MQYFVSGRVFDPLL